MTETTYSPDTDARARRNVVVLVAAQAILGAQMPMIFTIGGLAGQSLAPNPCLATMPISMIVLGSMLSATPMSALMQKRGRRFGFSVGTVFGALGALVAAFGLFQQSFVIFLLGSLLTGTYMSTQGFFRFAASDTASPEFQPKAISYVMAGGLLAALIGPQLGKLTNDALIVPFMGTYLLVMGLNLLGPVLFSFLDIPRPEAHPPGTAAPAPGRSRWELITTPRILVAVICAMVSYALMNLVMTSTPLAVVGCGFETTNAADVVSAHVLAMYVPSFFTGHVIARFGVEKVVGAGLVILAAAGAVALQGVQLENFFGALILLGVGWNFGFIGATTMLAQSHTKEERGRMQGLNDLIVFGGVTAASFASGGLMNCSGASAQAGWSAVNLAMAPLLALAGGALIWLVLRPKDDADA
ncbi:Major Facilitator Superfamily protein [Pseudooceanicola marinus]|uniref:Major Facilitator Superfamily protein n=1 Tax=Pseudooceanicola marinus TaxID=396013 RepID=A0A1X6YPL9_9RHOB|nr:MFS transporter [Pseudooceanicola marinus]PJE29530.1 MFS transporter [Pseudooceanicola marinus]SLN27469.1 Major Facilitator Superfamily protein [Pseudooceanicola marinus]